VLIGVLILWNAWTILRETVDILLEATPGDIDMSSMVRDLLQVEGVRGVHDLHVWSLSRSLRMLSAHVVIDDIPISHASTLQRRLGRLMHERYDIGHATLQLECEGCAPDELYCDIGHAMHRHGHGHGEHCP
jgi:cobalt-zinc-cadmium efflux system protein